MTFDSKIMNLYSEIVANPPTDSIRTNLFSIMMEQTPENLHDMEPSIASSLIDTYFSDAYKGIENLFDSGQMSTKNDEDSYKKTKWQFLKYKWNEYASFEELDKAAHDFSNRSFVISEGIIGLVFLTGPDDEATANKPFQKEYIFNE